MLKLGDLTRYISESVIIGFMLAAATLLAVTQLKNAVGAKDQGTAQSELVRAYQTLSHGELYNYRAVILSGSAIVLARLLRKLVRRFKLPQVDLLAVLVLTSLVAWLAGWTAPDKSGSAAVKLTPAVPQSLPSFHIPTVQPEHLLELSQGALAIAFIGVIEALAIAKAIAHQTHQKLDYNQQILAEGVANLGGGFFQSVPGSGSLSRSAINFQAGAVSRFSGIVSAASVAVALLLFAPLLGYIPQAALAGLLLVTAVRLVDFRRLKATLRASRYDAALVIVTAVTGILLDLDKAVLLGVIVSVILFVPRAAKLRASELVVAPEGVVRERTPEDVGDERTVIYDLEGELFFGAAPELDRHLAAISARIGAGQVKFVVLRLKRVRHPDAVSIERLADFLKSENGQKAQILLAGVRPDTLTILRNIGFTSWFPDDHVFPEEDREYSATLRAVRYAYAQLNDEAEQSRRSEPAYYLV